MINFKQALTIRDGKTNTFKPNRPEKQRAASSRSERISLSVRLNTLTRAHHRRSALRKKLFTPLTDHSLLELKKIDTLNAKRQRHLSKYYGFSKSVAQLQKNHQPIKDNHMKLVQMQQEAKRAACTGTPSQWRYRIGQRKSAKSLAQLLHRDLSYQVSNAILSDPGFIIKETNIVLSKQLMRDLGRDLHHQIFFFNQKPFVAQPDANDTSVNHDTTFTDEQSQSLCITTTTPDSPLENDEPQNHLIKSFLIELMQFVKSSYPSILEKKANTLILVLLVSLEHTFDGPMSVLLHQLCEQSNTAIQQVSENINHEDRCFQITKDDDFNIIVNRSISFNRYHAEAFDEPFQKIIAKRQHVFDLFSGELTNINYEFTDAHTNMPLVISQQNMRQENGSHPRFFKSKLRQIRSFFNP